MGVRVVPPAEVMDRWAVMDADSWAWVMASGREWSWVMHARTRMGKGMGGVGKLGAPCGLQYCAVEAGPVRVVALPCGRSCGVCDSAADKK